MSIAARIICSIVVLVVTCTMARADQGDDLVQAKLLADTSAIKPGEPFVVGVNLKITPHWHVYWINPGDSGQATNVKFDLPAGFSASELRFPVPERIVLPGDIISYGYENEATLLATITPPKDLKPGERVSIGAEADWLVCEKVCLPGSGKVKLELPVSHASEPANMEFFKHLWFADRPTGTVSAEAKPLDLSSGKGETEIRLSGEAFGEALGEALNDATGGVEVFPYPLDNVTISIGQARRDGTVTVIPISASVLPNQKVSAKTWKVMVVSRTKPSRFAYDVPLTIVTGDK